MSSAILDDRVAVEPINVCEQSTIDGLEERIQRCLQGRVGSFRLSLHPEGLVLEGYASTYHAKQLAQHEIMAHTRLPILANDIEVLVLPGHRP